MYYDKMTLEQLLDEYYYLRRDANDFFNDCSHPIRGEAAEIYDTLVNNYLEVQVEIERRTFHE